MSRIALVQGARRGIGLALTRALLETPDIASVIATCRDPDGATELEELRAQAPSRLKILPLDVTHEASIAAAAEQTRALTKSLHLLINASGVLHAGDGIQPEKRLEQLDPAVLRPMFEVNAFGPVLMAKHFHAFLRHEERSVFASLSARVGSIEDNRAGGWYAYRASKAALNMFTRTVALELARRAPHCTCVALHPGTVETELSRPFRRNVPPDKLFTPDRAARQLLDVVDGLDRDDSGGFFAWDGAPIPW